MTINIKYELLPYEASAVQKLSKYKVGALYMEMGTGKTITALSIIKAKYDANKINHCIWLCPCSITKETSDAIFNTAQLPKGFLTMCGIETLSSSKRAMDRLINMIKLYRCFLVVDESLLVKNPYAIRTKNIITLSKAIEYKLILNGTPVSKNYADLFAQFYLLDWRILGYQSYWSFAANHLEYDDKFKYMIRRVLNTDYLIDKISPFTYQTTKEDVLKLPKKIYHRYWFNLTDEQTEHYESIKEQMLDSNLLYGDYEDTIIFRLFNALQQITSGRRIISDVSQPIEHIPFYNGLENPRIQALLHLINTIDGNEKVIIWCVFTHEIKEVSKVLQSLGFKVSLYYGEMSFKERNKSLKDFENETRFLIANKGCASFGLNLQCCSNTAIFYSNDWQFTTRIQAEDRIHRIGQNKDVHIYDIFASSKIDERISMNMNSKESLLHSFRRCLKNKVNIKHWLDGLED